MKKYKVTLYVEYDKIKAENKKEAVELAWDEFVQDADVVVDILQTKVEVRK